MFNVTFGSGDEQQFANISDAIIAIKNSEAPGFVDVDGKNICRVGKINEDILPIHFYDVTFSSGLNLSFGVNVTSDPLKTKNGTQSAFSNMKIGGDIIIGDIRQE